MLCTSGCTDNRMRAHWWQLLVVCAKLDGQQPTLVDGPSEPISAHLSNVSTAHVSLICRHQPLQAVRVEELNTELTQTRSLEENVDPSLKENVYNVKTIYD